VIRLFRVYYPVRTLVLLAVEALIVWISFVLGTMVRSREDWLLRLNNELFIEGEFVKILAVTVIVLMISHGLDLYDSSSLRSKWEQIFRLLFVLGVVALALSAVGFLYSYFLPGHNFLPHDAALMGLTILTFTLLAWRGAYSWLVRQRYFRERVYVLGTGERALRVLDGLRQRSELGVEVVGWTGDISGELTSETVAKHLLGLAQDNGVHRVIVAMPNRRGTLPVDELLGLRLEGVKVEEATSWLEKINGHIEVAQLYPSWLLFADGFQFSTFNRFVRRVLNFAVALIGSVISLPLVPIVALVVKLGSPGPILYRQKRVGRAGATFYCYKFRTMRPDAEADTGATWATDNDPRITRVGKFLRKWRLDEIPQLWCVLKGDMNFVGPRPERPEFVDQIKEEERFRYYDVRHVVRPGITGWAQVNYPYGSTYDDMLEKLKYDLFYIKNASIGLDFWIVFQTVKIVLLGRGK
jgi:sugar transferase (PEP-CTERM system associated)